MGTHLIEDCSTASVLLLLASWFFYAIYGNAVIVSEPTSRHCYVKPAQPAPLATLPPATDPAASEYEDVAAATNYVAV